jgi:hypothetical protein
MSESLQLNHPLPFLKNGIAQVGLVVKDLEKAVEAYWKLFGIGPWHFYTYGKPLVKRMSYRGRPAEHKMRVALAWLGPLRIELIQILEGDTQLDIRGSWSWNGRETWEHAVDLLNRGVFNLDPMITNHYALEEWETAFANLRAKQDVKALIHPNGRGWA